MPFKVLTLILFSFLSFFCKAQIPDTLVVYEYVYEVDTVWIEEPLTKRDSIALSAMSLNRNSKIDLKTATISDNFIYDLEAKTELEMKKTGLLAALLLSMHTFANAQNEWECMVGFNNRFVEHQVSTINHPLQPGGFIGGEFYHPFSQGRLGSSVGVYLHIFSESEYKQNSDISSSLTEIEHEYAQDKTEALVYLFNRYLSDDYPEISIPLKLNYSIDEKYKLFLGVEGKFRYFDGWINNIGVLAGSSYKFSENWTAKVELAQELKPQKIVASQLQPISLAGTTTHFYVFFTRIGIGYKF